MLRAHRKFPILSKTKIQKENERVRERWMSKRAKKKKKKNEQQAAYKTLSKFYLWLFWEFANVSVPLMLFWRCCYSAHFPVTNRLTIDLRIFKSKF